MKKHFLPLLALMVSAAAYAQTHGVGINTSIPAATLDVVGKTPITAANPEGIIAPRFTREDLNEAEDAVPQAYGSAQIGAIVYVTDATVGTANTAKQTEFITTVGYYYFEGTKWINMSLGTLPPPILNEVDGIIGNEILNASNGLTRTGTSGTAADPFGVKLGGTLLDATSIFQTNLPLTFNNTAANTANAVSFTGTGKTAIETPLMITSGNPGANKVLTSDGSGNATWQDPAPASGGAEPWRQINTSNDADANNQNIYQGAKVGIGASYATGVTIANMSVFEVDGASTNKASTSGSPDVNFALSNLAASNASDNPAALGNIGISGMKDGGTYTIVCTATSGSGIPTLSLTANANNTITIIKYGDRKPLNKVANDQQVVFSIVCIGNTAYVYTTLFNP
ncbi:MAG: hypothetical protein LBE36_02365 [Flavobacteriaceae bacterium]|nr:hypothetical protein [Flavobacteriaceae bacterium]